MTINQKQNKVFYGWYMIAIAAMSLFFSAPGQTYSISTFIDAYIDDFQFSRTLISSIYSTATVCSGLLLVFVGKAVDKYGQRKTMVVAGIMLAITCFYNSFIANIYMMAFGFFILRYFGQGSLTLIPSSLVPQWFEEKRALAISLTNYGGAAANMVVPLINVWLITSFSWQFAWRVWAVLLLLIFVPIVYKFVVDNPEDLSLLPDNKPINDQETLKEEIQTMERNSWTLNQALKTKEFWFVALISMIVPMISTGLMFHFFSIMELKGLDKQSTAFVIALIALPGLFMPIISGLLIDKYRSKHIITLTMIVITLDMILLYYVNSTAIAALFMLIYGFSINIQSVTLGVIWPKYFGRKYLGSIRGAATVFMVIGSALGPLPFGLSYDMTGSYQLVIIFMGLITFLSLGMSLSIRKPDKK